MINSNNLYNYLESYCLGKDSARTGRQIARELFTDIRSVVFMVRELRLSGVIIGSSKNNPSGYYLPITNQEKRECLLTYRATLYNMLKVYNKMKKAVRWDLDREKQMSFI